MPKRKTCEPQNLVLPKSIALQGRITVAGAALFDALSESSYQVRAAYTGHGKLDDVLSLTVSAQPDGTFDIGGLTAGTYILQAGRDGIWFSQPRTLHVMQGVTPAPVTMNIPPPGAPVNLRLRSRDGEPLAGAAVTLDIPAGPLSDTLWPKELTTDTHGELLLDGLTAGRHHARLVGSRGAGASAAFSFEAPPISMTATTVTVAAPR